MAVQRREAFLCNFRAKWLQAAVKHQTVSTASALNGGGKIVHSGVDQALPKIPNGTPDCVGRYAATFPDIAKKLVRRDILVWSAGQAFS